MIRGKQFINFLLGLVFLAGIIAPVPECYVTGLVCPLKKSLVHSDLVLKDCPRHFSLSIRHDKTDRPVKDPSRHCWGARKPFFMMTYSPAFETTFALVLPTGLPPALFHGPAPQHRPAFASESGGRCAPPSPIPILLRKQSLLI